MEDGRMLNKREELVASCKHMSKVLLKDNVRVGWNYNIYQPQPPVNLDIRASEWIYLTWYVWSYLVSTTPLFSLPVNIISVTIIII